MDTFWYQIAEEVGVRVIVIGRHIYLPKKKNSARDRMFQLHFDKFTIPARSDENILEKNEKMLISNSEVFSEPMGKESSVGQIFQQQMPNISNKAQFRARL